MIEAVASWAAENPIAAQILADIGYRVANKIVGGLTGPTPYEQAAEQQLGIGQQLIPQLQAQAAGLPTAATQNIQRQLRKQTTAAQQSYAAATTARGGGGTPVAAQQARFRAAETEALGQQLGMAQQSAQTQLLGLYGGGMQAVGALEQMEMQAKTNFLTGVGEYLAYLREGKRDEYDQRMLDIITRSIGIQEQVLGQMAGTQPAPTASAWPPKAGTTTTAEFWKGLK